MSDHSGAAGGGRPPGIEIVVAQGGLCHWDLSGPVIRNRDSHTHQSHYNRCRGDRQQPALSKAPTSRNGHISGDNLGLNG